MSDKLMEGKRCLLTGATAGIGKESARMIAAMGAELIIVARNEEKAKKTVAWITQETGNDDVSYMMADFSSQDSIHQLVDNFKAKHKSLDVLFNNAGAAFMSRQENDVGIELTFAVNHLGYFLLTNLLLDMLTPTARIVNIASDAHKMGTMDFDDLMFTQGYGSMKAYSRSKLANMFFTYELARRLEGTGIAVNAVHPGFVKSDIGVNNSMIGRIIKPLVNLMALPVSKGAETGVYLASSPEVEGETGKYWEKKQALRSNTISYDEAVARRLWEVSAEMVGIPAE